ncbi:MAG TPA: hypothetical protein HPP95_05815 [Deltaproteobacteria bacterium]|nr:hypothetical protein [Deltaproteobacteria bacterium]
MKNRPHVVILGAGATIASIPDGDKNGKKSSVMMGFIEKLGMNQVIANTKLKTDSINLEDIYTELHERDDCENIRMLLDERIREYFSDLEIPDDPNIYDMLLLSLRKKDLIATFNWDPLLLQAYQRASKITKDLPLLTFLHGNVLVGYCRDHKYGGIIYAKCPECGRHFRPGRLLYPIRNKNYTEDPYIQDSWKAIRNNLKRAYLVTIFGYSAPKTDSEAISLMKEAWGTVDKRNLEDFEFIDIRPEEELVDNWKEFIHSHHYQIYSSFFESSLAQHPRRTTVELFDRTMECKFTKATHMFKPNMDWPKVQQLVDSLVMEEEKLGENEFLTVESA